MSGSHGNVGWLSRFGIGVQVLLTAVLALVALLLVNWLAARPGIRQRVDMTSAKSNTLSTASLGVLERLETDIQIDILYRPMNAPLTALGHEIMVRTDKLLLLMEDAANGRVAIQRVDTSDQEAWTIRQQQLRLRGYENGLVISNGDRREFLALSGDLATFDIGNPVPDSFIPPSIDQYDAERAITGAILDVTQGAERHVYFTYGFGELDALESADNSGLGLLAEELERDGVRVHRWNFLDDGRLPEDCDAVAVIGPQVGWPEDMYAEVVEYMERGGRLLVAPETVPELLRKSDVPDLLRHFDLEVSEGRVMKPLLDRRTGLVVQGQQECEVHVVTGDLMGPHPMLSAMRSAGAAFSVPITHRIKVGLQPPDGVSQTLFRSSPESWLDAPPCDRRYDAEFDGTFRSFPLASTVQRPPMVELEGPKGLEAVPEIRIVALGSEAMLTNAALQNPGFRSSDVLRAAFNWLLDREHRITVPDLDPDLRFLPLDRPLAVVWVMRVAQYLLPLAALLAGVLVWLRRAGGSRRVPARSLSPEEGAR
jgi:predicted small integral membrane protein